MIDFKEPPPQEFIDSRRKARMAMVDAYSPEIRALIHEYGLNAVKAFLDVGVVKPRHIRHLIETILNEFSPTRGSYSAQGARPDAEPKSKWRS